MYCEPFCGSAAVYFKLIQEGVFGEIKKQENSPRAILNDIDDEIINLFKVCRDFPEQLQAAIALTPYSRIEFNNAKNSPNCEDPIEKARKYLVKNWQSFAKQNETWGFQTAKEWGSQNSITDWSGIPKRLQVALKYFKSAYIENDCFERCITRWDTPHTLFYCDPPYVEKEQYYSHTFGEKDHIRLAELLHECKGQPVVSYYDHPFVRSLYNESSWEYHVKYSTISTGIRKKDKKQTRSKKTELLLIRKQLFSATYVSNDQQQLSLF
jgi:DNA adenine methylase